MKKTMLLSAIILLISLTFSSCEKIKSIADVTFETELSTDLDVNIQPTSLKAGVNGTFFEEATIDPLSDDEISKYAQKLKSVGMKDGKLEIISLDPSPITITSGTLSVSAPGFTTAEWDLSNQVLQAGTIIELTGDQINDINVILMALDVFTVTLQGTTDVDAGTYKATITINSEIVANPLND